MPAPPFFWGPLFHLPGVVSDTPGHDGQSEPKTGDRFIQPGTPVHDSGCRLGRNSGAIVRYFYGES